MVTSIAGSDRLIVVMLAVRKYIQEVTLRACRLMPGRQRFGVTDFGVALSKFILIPPSEALGITFAIRPEDSSMGRIVAE